MRAGCSIALGLLTVCLSGVEVRAGTPAAEQDSTRIQGTWKLVSLEDKGKPVPPESLPDLTIFFGKKQFMIEQDNVLTQAGSVGFDSESSPKSITTIVSFGKEEGKSMLGVYEFDKDSLKICLDPTGRSRPTALKTDEVSSFTLATYKRKLAPGDQGIEITGEYVEVTPDAQGKKHELGVVIERQGDAYLVTWKIDGKTAYVGTGLRRNDVFAVSWLNQGQVGVSVYLIEKGPKLVGHYAMMGGIGNVVPETLTPKKASEDRRDSPATEE
jgi:uncharacterized protein (TIGR03067 family)